MAAEKFKVVFEKVIDHCHTVCPYFGVDGGPGPVMCCDHPQLAKEGIRGYDTCIISHPVCDTGFPEKCPLRRLPEAKVEMRTSHNTGSPKLLDELRSLVTYGCDWDSPPVRKRAFDIIEQLRAGA